MSVTDQDHEAARRWQAENLEVTRVERYAYLMGHSAARYAATARVQVLEAERNTARRLAESMRDLANCYRHSSDHVGPHPWEQS